MNGTVYAHSLDLAVGTIAEVEINAEENFIRINNSKRNIANLAKGFKNPDHNVGLFFQYPVWNPSTHFRGKCYYVKMTREGKVVADFIPALAPTGVPCMFDTVTRKPFYNKGTGAFIVGLDMKQARKLGKLPSSGGTLTVSLPWEALDDARVQDALATAAEKGWTIVEQYREPEPTDENIAVDFLESTGEQYTMTDFFPDDTAEIKIDVNPVSAPNNLSVWIFVNADTGRTEGGRAFKAAASNNNLYFEYGAKNSNDFFGLNPLSPSFRERRTIELKNGYFNTGSEDGTFATQTFSTKLVELSIFRNIRDTTASVVDIYSCVLTKSGERKRDFAPMLDQNGTPCMHDTVSEQNFYNSGTGSFIAGFETVEAARRLAKLPKVAAGELTVSLPDEARDAASMVPTAISIAVSRGWTIIEQYRD